MKFVRFFKNAEIAYGAVSGDDVYGVAGDVFSRYAVGDAHVPLSDITVLAPCVPSKIVAIGLNYRSHAQELDMQLPDEPMVFMKPSTTVIGHNDNICYPSMSQRLDYEAELGVVIGKRCSHVSVDEAPQFILGYTCFNDVTARDLQQKDGQFTRSKGFDTFAPMGPCIETELDPENVGIECFLNGKKRQSGSTRDLIFSVYSLVSFLSRIMTLLPGDVIATGTPSGIGPMQVGDVVEVKIDGIGTLRNSVAAGK